MKDKAIIEAVQHWVEQFIVELNLCPFAKRELVQKRVRFMATDADTEEKLLIELESELQFLCESTSVETTLLIHPDVLKNFYDYNQFLDLADALLQEMGLDGVFQIASFHPRYQFNGTDIDDAENYTNRAPYPVLHLLREDSVKKAIGNHVDVEQIPVDNIVLMNNIGADKLESMLSSYMKNHLAEK